MRNMLLAAAATAAAVASFAAVPAQAREGCGAGGHRGPYGHCRPNRGRVVVGGPTLVVGSFYHGRGYWDGRRYWQHRRAYNRGWRYY